MIEQICMLMTVLTLTGIGGALSYRAGVLNIALEGFLLLGAFSMVAADSMGFSLFPSLILNILICSAAGYLWAFWSIRSGGNIFILGLGMNLLIAGGVTTLSSLLFGGKGVIQFDTLSQYSLFTQSIPGNIILTFIIMALTSIILFKTPLGIGIRAAGTSPGLLAGRNLKPANYKISALTLSASLSGFAGSIMVLRIGAFVPNMSANRGWIALVLVFIGRGNPLGVWIAAFVYSITEVFTAKMQGVGNIPESLILAFPYFITVIFLVLTNAVDKMKQPKQ